MIPQNIIREHILQAIQEINSAKIPINRESVNYDLFFEGNRYPPKYVISIANKYANGQELESKQFDAIEAKTFLPKLGFEVKLKYDINPGDVVGNQQISTLFGCGTQGGMRKSNKTNTLVIISDQTKPFYKDEWRGDVLHYTGMGITGDQKIDYAQNKTLAESTTNGVEVHLFEVTSPGKYTYKGIVELADKPYEKQQKDKDGKERKVVIFPVKIKEPVEEISDSIIFAKIGWSTNGWQGYDEKSSQNRESFGFRFIKETGIAHEWWNFFNYGDEYYYGFLQQVGKPSKFEDNGLMLFSSINFETKKPCFIGFYGGAKYGIFNPPIDFVNTISDPGIRSEVEKVIPVRSLNWRAKKDLSTCFFHPMEFELKDIGLTQWGHPAYIYVGENESIPKRNVRELLEKSVTIQKNLLKTSPEQDSAKILSDIEKTHKILNLYFKTTDETHFWAVLPSSQRPTGNQTEMWPIWKQKQMVSIGWRDLAEKLGQQLLQFSTYDEFVSAYRKIYPETQADMAWKFIYEMQKGDIILANKGHKSIFARGVIKSQAKIFEKETIQSSENAALLSEWPIYREVEWEEITPEVPIPSELEGKFSRRVISLTKEEYDTLFDKSLTLKKIDKKQIILYGPPGTGKTYSSVIKAHEIIFGHTDPVITYRLLQEKLQSQPKNEIDVAQLTWLEAIILTFYQLNKEKLQVDEIKNSKIIQDFSAYKNNRFISNTIWNLLLRDARLDSETVKVKNKTGREYFDKDSDSNWFLTEKGKEFQKGLIEDLINVPESSNSQFNFITFHQSFSYEDFVEGIRPDLENADEIGIVYRIKDGIFKEICKKAAMDPHHNYVLVIDEINRGNISKIFGELITLLEDNKRMGENEEITVRLPYSGEIFGVPNNVYIIGTMNSTDKSIALVDIALRRRFHFERLNVEYDLIVNEDAKKFLMKLNSIICAIKNPDYEIGHYYMMNIPEIDDENKELKKVFTNQMLPLLEEYFFNDWEALATILGRDSIKIDPKKKLVWNEDTGKFEEDTGDYDLIFGLSIKSPDIVFENTMKNLGIRHKEQETTQ